MSSIHQTLKSEAFFMILVGGSFLLRHADVVQLIKIFKKTGL